MNLLHYIFIITVLSRNSYKISALEDDGAFKLSDKLSGCSKRLSRLIANICNNKYKIVKRETSPFIDKLVPESLHELMKRERLKRRTRRTRRQVADECCDHTCTVENIILYCPANALVLKENPDIFD